MSIISRLRKQRPYLTAPFNANSDPNSDDGRVDVSSLGPAPAPIGRRPTGQMSDLPSVPDLTPTDYYQMNPRVRPKIDPTIRDPQTRMEDYESNVLNYQPQKEGVGHLLARTGLGFLAGGIPGAIYTAGEGLINRRGQSKDWQQRELANTEGTIQRLGNRRKEGLQENLIRAQTDKAEREPDYNLSPGEARMRGNQVIVSRPAKAPPETGFTLGEGQARFNPQGGVIASRPAKAQPTKPPPRIVVNGTVLEQQEDGTLKPVYQSPEKPDITPYQQQEHVAKAAALAGKIDGARRDAQNALAQAGKLPDSDPNKAKYVQNYQQALADGNAAATELNAGYGDLYEAGAGTSDASGAGTSTQGIQWPYYKPKSAAPVTRGSKGNRGSKYVAPKVSASRLKELMQ